MATSRIPDPGDPLEDEGIPGQESGLPAKRVTGDPQDDLAPPTDRPLGAEEYGTTAAEHAAGEALDGRLRREQPDRLAGADDGQPYPEDPDERSGRLVADADEPLAGTDAGADAGGYAPEERAVHTRERGARP
jgi:hypothetical protein